MMHRSNSSERRPFWVGLLLCAAAGFQLPGGSCLAGAGRGVLYVDDDATPGGNGLRWSSAFKFLQDALTFAADPAHGISQIHVAGGTYQPDRDAAHLLGTGDRDAAFAFVNNVAVMGGFLGLAAKRGQNPDSRDISRNETILSGDLAGNDGPSFANATDNSYHVAVALNVDSSAIYDGVTFAAGHADGPGVGADPASRDQGSGVNVYFATPTLMHCTFRGNWNANHGALNDHGDSTLVDCTFRENHSLLLGAGLYIHHHSDTIATGCSFINNSCEGDGGGAYCRSMHQAMLMDCTFAGNSAVHGGGLYVPIDGAAMFANCTFTGNHAQSGGGMYNTESAPMVMGCHFIDNTADATGAGVYNDHAAGPLFMNCDFRGNVTAAGDAGGGGGMWNAAGFLTIDSCTYTNNTGLSGGGVYNGDHCAPVITNCTFTGNHAGEGGGMSSAETDGFIADCTFVNNTAFLGDFPVGGGAQNYISNITLTRCTFIGNQATFGGGGVYNEAMFPVLTNCTFLGNSTHGDNHGWGGGLLNGYYTYATIAGCSFVGNTANQGGGIHNMVFSETHFVNCTATANVATGSGDNSGAGGFFTTPGSIPVVVNCILWNNTPDQFAGDPAVVSSTCVDGGYAGVANINANPLFMHAPSPGADGLWGTNDDDYGDLRLQPGSPCIDAGDDSAVPPSLNTDLAGHPRYVDDPATPNGGVPSGFHAIIDLGSFEFQGTICPADVASSNSPSGHDGMVNVDDLLFILNHWNEAGGPADIAPLGGDGVVNVSDLQAVLDGWGQCPD